MKICLVSGFPVAWQELGLLTAYNKKAYCKSRRYAHHVFYDDKIDKSRPVTWSRIRFVINRLPHFDWVVWADPDSIIANPLIDIASFCDDNYQIILSQGQGNKPDDSIFIIKGKSFWTKDFLERVYSHSEYIGHPLEEKAAFLFEIDGSTNLVKVLPQNELNATENSYNNNIIKKYINGTYAQKLAAIQTALG